jgi:hypothetical protein
LNLVHLTRRVSSILDGNEVNDIEAEMVSNMTDEENRVPRTIPVIKTEPEVCVYYYDI